MLIPDTIIGEGHVWESHPWRLLCLGTFIPDPAYHVLAVDQCGHDNTVTSIRVVLCDVESGDVAHAYPRAVDDLPREGWRQQQELHAIEACVRRVCASGLGPAIKCATRTAYLSALLGCTSAAWRTWRGMESPAAPLTKYEWELMLEPLATKSKKASAPERRLPIPDPPARTSEPMDNENDDEYEMVCIGPGMMRVKKQRAAVKRGEQGSSLMSAVFRLSQSALH